MIMTWGKEGRKKAKDKERGVQRNSTGPIMADEKLKLQQMRDMLKYICVVEVSSLCKGAGGRKNHEKCVREIRTKREASVCPSVPPC